MFEFWRNGLARFKASYKAAKEFPVSFVPPKPKSTRALVLDFIAMHPKASVGDWMEFAISLTHKSWAEGYKTALEARAFGDIQLPEPEAEEREEWVLIDYDYIPVKESVETEPVVLVTEDGTPYLRGE